ERTIPTPSNQRESRTTACAFARAVAAAHISGIDGVRCPGDLCQLPARRGDIPERLHLRDRVASGHADHAAFSDLWLLFRVLQVREHLLDKKVLLSNAVYIDYFGYSSDLYHILCENDFNVFARGLYDGLRDQPFHDRDDPYRRALSDVALHRSVTAKHGDNP